MDITQTLPIVPFGKYKDKSVLDLLADEKYVEWLKQQSWFPNQKQIYNIVVHQTIPTTNNSKTPEHNRLQNLFLEKDNQQKLISKLVNINKVNGLINLFNDEEIIRCFGINNMPELINNLDNTSIKFEDKYNWDLIINYKDKQTINITSNSEIELYDKEKYKEQYDMEQKEKHNNNLILIDRLIDVRIKLDEEKMSRYEEDMQEYILKNQTYEIELLNYVQQKSQNDIDIKNYEKDIKSYDIKREMFINHKQSQICVELGINYNNFVNWNITNNGYSHLDKDTKYTQEEKRQLKNIVNDRVNPFIIEFERINKRPQIIEKINLPTKPSLPKKPWLNHTEYITEKNEHYEIFIEFCKKIKHIGGLYSLADLQKYKKEYEKIYIEEYEKKFEKNYEEYRKQYYKNIINKYCDENESIYVSKKNENLYEIKINLCDYYYEICCELKPTLSDDYPCVLRKIKTQIKLTSDDNVKKCEEFYNKNKIRMRCRDCIYTLIIGNFTSTNVSNEQLITIFNQSNIKVIFTNELFGTTRVIKYENKTDDLSENLFIKENELLKNELLETQQKLLEEQEKNRQLEEKIRQLEEEIQLLKTQKQAKSIKDYFGKK